MPARDEFPLAQHQAPDSKDGDPQAAERHAAAGQKATPPASSEQAPDEQALQLQVAQMQAERDAALARLDTRARRQARGGAIRRFTVVVLVVLVALLVPITATTLWVRHTVLNTDNYVATVAPIAKNKAVTAAVARTATDELFTALNPEAEVKSALPPKAGFLAAPIANGVKSFVQTQVNNLLNTPVFARIWTNANRAVHQQLMSVLNGHSKALTTSHGQVVLSVVPLLNEVLKRISTQVTAITGKSVTLPTLSGTELPSAACAKISQAIGRQLKSNCGQIPLFPASKLNQAQHAVRAFKNLTVLLVIVTPLLALLALWLSRRRRRTLCQMAVGVVVVMVVLRRTVFWLQDTLIKTGKPENKDARSAIAHQLLHGFFTMSLWVLWISVAVLVVALVTGPYRWAVAARSWTANAARTGWTWTRSGVGKARGAATQGQWVPDHLDALKVGGAVVAVLLLLILPISWIGLIVIAALTVAWELWLYRIGTGPRPAH